MSPSKKNTKGSINLVEEGLGWLLQSTFLAFLDPTSRKITLDLMEKREYQADEEIITLGEPSPGMHLVTAGQTLIRTPDPAGGMRVIAHLEAGHVLGEMSLVRDKSASAQVLAGTRVRTLFLPRKGFNRLYRRSKRFREYIVGLVKLREQWPQLVDVVSRNKFLRMLGKDETERFLESGRLKEIDAGVTLLEAGKAADRVFLVVKGSVAVHEPGKDGKLGTALAVMKRGDLVGEAAVVLQSDRTADVVTLEKTELLEVGSNAFIEIVSRNPLVFRQILQGMARTGVVVPDNMRKQTERMVTFVYGTEAGVGTTTIAYGLAGALRVAAPFNPRVDATLVDLDGDENAKTLGIRPVPTTVGGVKVRRILPSRNWDLDVVWPRKASDAPALLEAIDRGELGKSGVAPVIVTGRPRKRGSAQVLEASDAVVFVRRAGQHLDAMDVQRNQIRLQAIRNVQGQSQPLATSHKAVRIPEDPKSFRHFWTDGEPGWISTPTTPFGEACTRLGRVLRGSSVGVALGGGGAFGFAHVGLLRKLRANSIPIDYVAGVSFGSLVGTTFVGGGMDAAERLIRDGGRILDIAMDATISTQGFADYVDQACHGITLEMTDIPFYPVGYDLVDEQEFVMSEGSMGLALLSASSMPGTWPALEYRGHRIVDGGVVNNVPVSTLWEAGADFILGSSIIPSRSGGARLPFDRLETKLPRIIETVVNSKLPVKLPPSLVQTVTNMATGLITRSGLFDEVIMRINDLVRSLYLLMGQNGRDRALLADYVFELEVPGFDIYDFVNGEKIADAGEKLATEDIQEIIACYEEEPSRRF